ncbi:hypothetical protein UlMin_011981 [Ulmus minor]
MDSIISSALIEICSEGDAGVALPALWSRLNPSFSAANLEPSPGLKQALWSGLLAVPSLRFFAQKALFSPSDPSIHSFEEAEKLRLKLVADERLRDNFLGLYNVKSSNVGLPKPQQRVLERLAIARKKGITQSQLAKELGIEPRNFFYVLRNLECQGLIVRQSAVVKTKESCNDGESRNCPSVTTNLVYLSCYAEHLGSQQKIEITKEEQTSVSLENLEGSAKSSDDFAGKKVKDDVLVKDYLPAMKAVCDKLEKANGKVLVVSDIKKELGYIGAPGGHKEWRKVSSKLKAANIVEEFEAKVNEKVERCLRLLKSFCPKNFEPKTLGCIDDDFDGEEQVKFGKKCQISNQLVELPIEFQIYDMIDAAGPKGMTVMEVCKRLGIDNKKNHNRLVNMFTRFGMYLQAENHKKCLVYRVWTPGRRNPDSANKIPDKSIAVNDSNVHLGNLDSLDMSAEAFLGYDLSVSTGDTSSPKKFKDSENNTDLSVGSPKNTESNLLSSNSQRLLLESGNKLSDSGLDLVSIEMETNSGPLETPPSMLKPHSSGSNQRYPCLLLTVDGARREKIILERLQNEKFILRAELHRWLSSVEKDKCTTTDRKTIDRLLNKLQQQGHCKIVQINVPRVTNYSRRHNTHVVLHPSIQLCTELIGEIHDRQREFESQSRGQSSSRSNNIESVPELKDVQRTQNYASSHTGAVRAEIMRANGFIMAKMIRSKLLHSFLWDYLNSSVGSIGSLSSEKLVSELSNPHTSSKLFSLEAAIKAIPVELFLQVVGSSQKFTSMIDKCKKGLCLSDLPIMEYKSLMDTHATGRLSMVIDILRRLKLIRMVNAECPKDGLQVMQRSFTHALELKPYIEEPIPKDTISLSFRPLDLRPRIRHDFIFSSRKAVDEYWQTLEYCYAAADQRAALLAFPGSAVHEVFRNRSWASVRVMTADQRAELLKLVMKDDRTGKLSFKECGKIAKDLNLSLEQVLRVYYDKRQQRLNNFQGEGDDIQTLRSEHVSSSRKRKRSSGGRSKIRKVDEVGQVDEQRLAVLPDTSDQFLEGEEFSVPSEKHDNLLQAFQEDDHLENEGEAEPNEDDEGRYSAISKSTFSKLRTRKKRFSWTEEADRKLVIQYVRYRAALGAKYHRTDWTSISELPAPPSTCQKRIASLNRNVKFRKAVMRLCNVLSERYVKFLEKTQSRSLDKDACAGEGLNTVISDGGEHTQEIDLEGEAWDDFEISNIKVALDEVLRCKWMAKLEASKRVGCTHEEWSALDINAQQHGVKSNVIGATASCDNIQNQGIQQKNSTKRSRAQRLHKKLIKLLNEEVKVSRQVYKSLAISNAVELFKLIFLSTSTASTVPNLLAEILRRYSEHDLFAAFNYLREKNFMVGGSHSQPFFLSQQFLHSLSKSPFPTNSGNRAAKFANWIHERDRDLTEGGIDLSDDLQCGDIFHLFALVSSGQLSLSLHLPNEGVGEAEDLRNFKRKIDHTESSDGDKAKKQKSMVAAEGEIISRREKGFPGIILSIQRTTFTTAVAVDLFKDENCTGVRYIHGEDLFDNTSCQSRLDMDHIKEMHNSSCSVSVVENSCELPWKAMADYSAHLLPIHSDQEKSSTLDPEVFRAVYGAIQKAGDQGLSIEEVSQVINVPGENMAELIISVLQTFRRVLKVNAFETVHFVDALYRPKYFLTSTAVMYQDLKAPSSEKTTKGDKSHLILQEEKPGSSGARAQKETNINVDDVHKVTILNFPEEVAVPFNENDTGKHVSPDGDKEDKSINFSSAELCMPILPWINGDGTINKIIYKGLTRRVLGIVMQNPGILEDQIIQRMDVLNPQSCRKLLELMILDKHLYVRKMQQTTSNAPPSILGTLFKSSFSKPKLVCHDHLFANPMSTLLL